MPPPLHPLPPQPGLFPVQQQYLPNNQAYAHRQLGPPMSYSPILQPSMGQPVPVGYGPQRYYQVPQMPYNVSPPCISPQYSYMPQVNLNQSNRQASPRPLIPLPCSSPQSFLPERCQQALLPLPPNSPQHWNSMQSPLQQVRGSPPPSQQWSSSAPSFPDYSLTLSANSSSSLSLATTTAVKSVSSTTFVQPCSSTTRHPCSEVTVQRPGLRSSCQLTPVTPTLHSSGSSSCKKPSQWSEGFRAAEKKSSQENDSGDAVDTVAKDKSDYRSGDESSSSADVFDELMQVVRLTIQNKSSSKRNNIKNKSNGHDTHEIRHYTSTDNGLKCSEDPNLTRGSHKGFEKTAIETDISVSCANDDGIANGSQDDNYIEFHWDSVNASSDESDEDSFCRSADGHVLGRDDISADQNENASKDSMSNVYSPCSFKSSSDINTSDEEETSLPFKSEQVPGRTEDQVTGNFDDSSKSLNVCPDDCLMMEESEQRKLITVDGEVKSECNVNSNDGAEDFLDIVIPENSLISALMCTENLEQVTESLGRPLKTCKLGNRIQNSDLGERVETLVDRLVEETLKVVLDDIKAEMLKITGNVISSEVEKDSSNAVCGFHLNNTDFSSLDFENHLRKKDLKNFPPQDTARPESHKEPSAVLEARQMAPCTSQASTCNLSAESSDSKLALNVNVPEFIPSSQVSEDLNHDEKLKLTVSKNKKCLEDNVQMCSQTDQVLLSNTQVPYSLEGKISRFRSKSFDSNFPGLTNCNNNTQLRSKHILNVDSPIFQPGDRSSKMNLDKLSQSRIRCNSLGTDGGSAFSDRTETTKDLISTKSALIVESAVFKPTESSSHNPEGAKVVLNVDCSVFKSEQLFQDEQKTSETVLNVNGEGFQPEGVCLVNPDTSISELNATTAEFSQDCLQCSKSAVSVSSTVSQLGQDFQDCSESVLKVKNASFETGKIPDSDQQSSESRLNINSTVFEPRNVSQETHESANGEAPSCRPVLNVNSAVFKPAAASPEIQQSSKSQLNFNSAEFQPGREPDGMSHSKPILDENTTAFESQLDTTDEQSSKHMLNVNSVEFQPVVTTCKENMQSSKKVLNVDSAVFDPSLVTHLDDDSKRSEIPASRNRKIVITCPITGKEVFTGDSPTTTFSETIDSSRSLTPDVVTSSAPKSRKITIECPKTRKTVLTVESPVSDNQVSRSEPFDTSWLYSDLSSNNQTSNTNSYLPDCYQSYSSNAFQETSEPYPIYNQRKEIKVHALSEQKGSAIHNGDLHNQKSHVLNANSVEYTPGNSIQRTNLFEKKPNYHNKSTQIDPPVCKSREVFVNTDLINKKEQYTEMESSPMWMKDVAINTVDSSWRPHKSTKKLAAFPSGRLKHQSTMTSNCCKKAKCQTDIKGVRTIAQLFNNKCLGAKTEYSSKYTQVDTEIEDQSTIGKLLQRAIRAEAELLHMNLVVCTKEITNNIEEINRSVKSLAHQFQPCQLNFKRIQKVANTKMLKLSKQLEILQVQYDENLKRLYSGEPYASLQAFEIFLPIASTDYSFTPQKLAVHDNAGDCSLELQVKHLVSEEVQTDNSSSSSPESSGMSVNELPKSNISSHQIEVPSNCNFSQENSSEELVTVITEQGAASENRFDVLEASLHDDTDENRSVPDLIIKGITSTKELETDTIEQGAAVKHRLQSPETRLSEDSVEGSSVPGMIPLKSISEEGRNGDTSDIGSLDQNHANIEELSVNCLADEECISLETVQHTASVVTNTESFKDEMLLSQVDIHKEPEVPQLLDEFDDESNHFIDQELEKNKELDQKRRIEEGNSMKKNRNVAVESLQSFGMDSVQLQSEAEENPSELPVSVDGVSEEGVLSKKTGSDDVEVQAALSLDNDSDNCHLDNKSHETSLSEANKFALDTEQLDFLDVSISSNCDGDKTEDELPHQSHNEDKSTLKQESVSNDLNIDKNVNISEPEKTSTTKIPPGLSVDLVEGGSDSATERKSGDSSKNSSSLSQFSSKKRQSTDNKIQKTCAADDKKLPMSNGKQSEEDSSSSCSIVQQSVGNNSSPSDTAVPPADVQPPTELENSLRTMGIEPSLFQSVLWELLKSNPSLTSNPQLLQNIALQQCVALQFYMSSNNQSASFPVAQSQTEYFTSSDELLLATNNITQSSTVTELGVPELTLPETSGNVSLGTPNSVVTNGAGDSLGQEYHNTKSVLSVTNNAHSNGPTPNSLLADIKETDVNNSNNTASCQSSNPCISNIPPSRKNTSTRNPPGNEGCTLYTSPSSYIHTAPVTSVVQCPSQDTKEYSSKCHSHSVVSNTNANNVHSSRTNNALDTTTKSQSTPPPNRVQSSAMGVKSTSASLNIECVPAQNVKASLNSQPSLVCPVQSLPKSNTDCHSVVTAKTVTTVTTSKVANYSTVITAAKKGNADQQTSKKAAIKSKYPIKKSSPPLPSSSNLITVPSANSKVLTSVEKSKPVVPRIPAAASLLESKMTSLSSLKESDVTASQKSSRTCLFQQKSSSEDWEDDAYGTSFQWKASGPKPLMGLNFSDFEVPKKLSTKKGKSAVKPSTQQLKRSCALTLTARPPAIEVKSSISMPKKNSAEPNIVLTKSISMPKKSLTEPNITLKPPQNKPSDVKLSPDGLKREISIDDDTEEENWQQVTKKKKPTKTEVIKLTTGKQSALKSRKIDSTKKEKESRKNNFERLIERILKTFPGLTRDDAISVVGHIRGMRGGLSGLTLEEILTKANRVVETKFKDKMKKSKRSSSAERKQNLTEVILPPFLRSKTPPPASVPSSIHFANELYIDEDDSCVICFDSMKLKTIKILDCGHGFHDECIKRWVYGRERTCPTCRSLALFPEEFPKLK